ncbi:cytochrome P450 [Catenaria anguillulae PL171]|uniref:Cytochrome P450 n=1 Tax=Catenaria anguillulae PL171 TaxID=765915 RepID=A0A1Y2HJE8_9FUNG|nr:cytochrome P450 [Catenaria anguillulae PL171]
MPVLSTHLLGTLADDLSTSSVALSSQLAGLWRQLHQSVGNAASAHSLSTLRKNLAVIAFVVVPTIAGIGSIAVTHYKAYRISKRLAIIDQDGAVSRLPGPPTTIVQRLITGHVSDLIQHADDIPRYQAALIQKYGPVYQTFDMFGVPRVTVADPKALYAVFSARSYQFLKFEEVSRGISVMAGNHGLLVVEGDEHRFHRRVLNPIFNLKLLKHLAPIMSHAFDELEFILDQTCGSPADFQKLATAATLNVIGRSMLATDFAALGPNPSPLNAAYSVLVKVFEFSSWNVAKDVFPFLAHIPVPANTRLAQAQKTVWNRIDAMLAQSMSKQPATSPAPSSSDQGELLSSALVEKLLQESQKDSGFTITAVRDELLTFLLAGHETSSNLLGMIAFYLAKFPDTQDALHAALEAHDPAEDLAKCQYLNWVINESLRLHSPAYMTLRTAAADMDLDMNDGRVLQLAKDTVLFIPIQAIHLNPAVWGDDAEQFRPDRWANYAQTSDVTSVDLSTPNVRVLHPYQFMPFLGGPRACIGKQMALMTVRMLTSRLVRRYKMTIPAGSELKMRERPPIEFTITAKAKKVELCFERR